MVTAVGTLSLEWTEVKHLKLPACRYYCRLLFGLSFYVVETLREIKHFIQVGGNGNRLKKIRAPNWILKWSFSDCWPALPSLCSDMAAEGKFYEVEIALWLAV